VKTHKARLDWRAGRRRRAWELKQAGWKQTEIAAALGVTSGAVSQWLTRARAEGVEEGLRAHPASGRPPKLTAEQRAQLPALLDRGAEAYGFRGQVWTCQRVGEVIRRTFGVTYTPAPVGRLLHRLGYRVQRPIERATQHDEAAVRGWWERRWPARKKSRRRGPAPCLDRPVGVLSPAPSRADLGALSADPGAPGSAHPRSPLGHRRPQQRRTSLPAVPVRSLPQHRGGRFPARALAQDLGQAPPHLGGGAQSPRPTQQGLPGPWRGPADPVGAPPRLRARSQSRRGDLGVSAVP